MWDEFYEAMGWSYKNNGALRVQRLLYSLNLVTSSELLLRVYLLLALLPGAYARLLVSSPRFINISWHFKCFMAELTGLLVSQVPGNVIREGYALLCPKAMLYLFFAWPYDLYTNWTLVAFFLPLCLCKPVTGLPKQNPVLTEGVCCLSLLQPTWSITVTFGGGKNGEKEKGK